MGSTTGETTLHVAALPSAEQPDIKWAVCGLGEQLENYMWARIEPSLVVHLYKEHIVKRPERPKRPCQ